jgi:hypothetical protein
MQQRNILSRIAEFKPTDGNWRELDDLLGGLWSAGVTTECLPILFHVFERYPDEDGAGVLWGIVHGVEASELRYEEPLRVSMARRPSHMGRIMLDRLERTRAV